MKDPTRCVPQLRLGTAKYILKKKKESKANFIRGGRKRKGIGMGKIQRLGGGDGGNKWGCNWAWSKWDGDNMCRKGW